MFNRGIIIVLDSCGIGHAKDAEKFKDLGANTFKSASEAISDFKLPVLESIGFGHIVESDKVKPIDFKNAYVTRMNELSIGKDTTVGHWEFMGVHTKVGFPVFTDTGFPKALIDELEAKSGRKCIGNIASSGTTILDEFGQEHLDTGALIVYTSNDSVLQIAAHEEVVSVEELYKICDIAREITMKEEWKVARIIARPFLGTPGNFKRTSNRHDISLSPPIPTVLDNLDNANICVTGVGKIADIYNNCGITKSVKSVSNIDGMEKTIELVKSDTEGLIFTNLVEFDSEFGHRRNALGYAEALMTFDKQLALLLNELKEDDVLFITADHGNDPNYQGTDHTRELVPLVIYSKSFKGHGLIDEPQNFGDLGATIADNFNVSPGEIGTSFLNKLV